VTASRSRVTRRRGPRIPCVAASAGRQTPLALAFSVAPYGCPPLRGHTGGNDGAKITGSCTKGRHRSRRWRQRGCRVEGARALLLRLVPCVERPAAARFSRRCFVDGHERPPKRPAPPRPRDGAALHQGRRREEATVCGSRERDEGRVHRTAVQESPHSSGRERTVWVGTIRNSHDW
jgi:hypothetical protein